MTIEHTSLLVQTIARHFPAARIEKDEVHLGFAGVSIRCEVNKVTEAGSTLAASLFFDLRGGPLGEQPIFASISGYGGSPEEAIVSGGCYWACSFGPVLRQALTGEHGATRESDVPSTFEARVHGRGVQVVVAALDRAVLTHTSDGASLGELIGARRKHLGGDAWLAERILASDVLPILPSGYATVLSVFVMDLPERRVVEVKVNGVDWPAAARVFDAIPLAAGESFLLRELAVLPASAPAELERASLCGTLADVGSTLQSAHRNLVAWQGWSQHGGRLSEPASLDAVERLEGEIGPLPESYRDFLLRIAESGAGPGYGLLSPFGAAQRQLARGEFTWRDREEPDTDPAGVLALAHAGCGLVWLLVVSGARHGEVWIDGRPSGSAQRVAESFEAWYRAWLDALLRDRAPFAQWDSQRCATVHVLSQMLESLEATGMDSTQAVAELPNRLRSLSVLSGGGPYFPQNAALDPCHPCVARVSNLGIAASAFKPGSAPRQAERTETRGGLGARVRSIWSRSKH